MTLCRVQGCEREASEVFEWREPILREWAVCQPHSLELKVSPYLVSSEGQLVVGAGAPPQLIDYAVEWRSSPHCLITMTFGHDGVEEQKVEFFMTLEDAQNIASSLKGLESKPDSADDQF